MGQLCEEMGKSTFQVDRTTNSKTWGQKGTWFLEESEEEGNGRKETVEGGRPRKPRPCMAFWVKEKNLNFIVKGSVYILRESLWMLCGVQNAMGEGQEELGSYCSCLGERGLWLRLKKCQ